MLKHPLKLMPTCLKGIKNSETQTTIKSLNKWAPNPKDWEIEEKSLEKWYGRFHIKKSRGMCAVGALANLFN